MDETCKNRLTVHLMAASTTSRNIPGKFSDKLKLFNVYKKKLKKQKPLVLKKT